jgi:hypothetical protein
MISNTEEMWKSLNQYKIVKLFRIKAERGVLHYTIISKGNYSRQFETVIIGYNRVMVLYEEMVKNYPIDEPKIELLGQSGIILLITTLESYLERVFYKLCRLYKVRDIDEKTFKKFLNKFNLKFNYDYSELGDISLSNFIPERLSFQDKRSCKEAFLLFNLKISEIDKQLWDRIYADKESYMNIRHGIIHAGPEYTLYKINHIDISYFEKIMFDCANFLSLIDAHIVEVKKLFKSKLQRLTQ